MLIPDSCLSDTRVNSRHRYRLGVLPVIALFLLMTFPAMTTAGKLYDVSYLWHHDIKSVLAYREKVGSILGENVARGLKVVSRGDLFGLVYHRRGDSDGAVRVAKTHTRLLKKSGLEAAAPVASADWRFFGEENTGSSPATASAASSRSKMTKNQRAQEIRDLEAAVEAYISELRRQGQLTPDERTGWSVYDFTTGEKLVTINEDMQFQAASLVKPFIAAAFFHKVEDEALVYGPESRRHMVRMIQHSSNPSTNWVLRQVGGPAAAQKILKTHYPGIFQDTHLVEYIPAGGRTYRNKASIHDYSRFLYALWTEQIPGAPEIKRLMALPGTDRIYTGAKSVPKGTKVYNKTGSTARVCGDMGILNIKGPNGKRYPYTIIGVIEKQSKADNYTAWIRSRSDVIRNVSNIVYEGITQHHRLNGLL